MEVIRINKPAFDPVVSLIQPIAQELTILSIDTGADIGFRKGGGVRITVTY